MNTVSNARPGRRRARLSMVLVLALFAAPLLLAWLAISVFPDWQPESKTNHGDLVQPVRPLPAFGLTTLQEKSIDETFLRGKWTILYLAKGACERHCVERLYTIRQIRLAQGKNIDRLQRLMLWNREGIDDEQRQTLQAHFPGQLIALVGDDEPLLRVFALDEQAPFAAGRVYLIDPLGNLMMKYESDAAPRGMIKDLEKLLKYSRLG